MSRACRLILCSVSAVLIVSLLGCSNETPKQDFDAAVRGSLSEGEWKPLGDSFKFDQCLRYKISVMRQFTSQVSSPVELINYYPTWVEGLADCDLTYNIERKKAEQLRELAATEMAKALGEETTSYLNF